MMTRKHFEAIAQRINGATHVTLLKNKRPTVDKLQLVEMLASYFQFENPRFDRARFLDACGLGEEQ